MIQTLKIDLWWRNHFLNGHYYYCVFPMPSPDLFPGSDTELLKQKMLEHESVFGNQVFEPHRIYRVQKNLMDEIRNKEQSEEKTFCEISSSSSAFPSQVTPDHAHRQNSSSFLFRNSVCGALPVSGSGSEFIPSSDSSSLKGQSVLHAPVSFRNCASSKNSVVLESRPTKLRKMIDLELPADEYEYTDTDELEQYGNRMSSSGIEEKLFPTQQERAKYHGVHLESDSCSRKPYALADLNEPLNDEETIAEPFVDVLGVHKQDLLSVVPSIREDVSWKPRQWNINVTQVSSSYKDKGNGQNWFSSTLKAEGTKDNGKAVHQTNFFEMPSRPVQVFENHQQPRIFPPHRVKENPLLAKETNDLMMYEKSRSLPSFGNPGGLMTYASSSNLVNSWNLSWDKSSSHLSQKPMSVQMGPFFHPDSLSKGSQSSGQSNNFLGAWWHRHADPRSIPDSHRQTPVQNSFHHGSSSGKCKELPGRDYVSGSCNDNIATGSSSFLKAKNCFDLNSTGDLNLNVVPDDLSNESLTPQGAVKQEDPVSVFPWLRAKASNNEAARARNSPHIRESGLFHDPRELCDRIDVRNALDRQSCLTSTSSNLDATREKGKMISENPSSAKMILGVPIFQARLSGEQEIDSGKKKILFDINVPFDDPEEFVNAAATNEAVLVEKIEDERHNCFRNMIDLNSCFTEEENPSRASLTISSTTANSLKKPERCVIIDLEAPVDLEAEAEAEAEEESSSVPDEGSLIKQHQMPLHPLLRDSIDSSRDKLVRAAAEAIVTISASAPENRIDGIMIPEGASASGDVLSWFVDIICPPPEDVETCPDDDQDCLFNDSDSFEEMTLNLSECTLEEYIPNPPNFGILAVAETEPPSVMGQTRRTRRGRQRKDFQRDILPGLISLARNEITEDLQTFTGLMRTTGYAWDCAGRRNSARKGPGRGRRRTLVPAHPPSPPEAAYPGGNATCLASQMQNPNNGEIILEDGSLTSWGKTTRRPRRQRCSPNSR